MSKKINPTSVGLFIIVGVALGVAGLLLFSTSKWFRKTQQIICYFDESLTGLQEGAAVRYRGVAIGSVSRVMVRFNQAPDDFAMPVLIEFEERLLMERMPDAQYAFSADGMEERIAGGLRATLESESLLTGVLYIGLDIHPNAPPPRFHQVEPIYLEIPSQPTQIQVLLKNLASLDVRAITTNINNLITKLDASVGRLDVQQISDKLTHLLTSVDRLVNSPDLTNALASLTPTLRQYEELGAKLTARVDPLADSLTNSLAQADLALAQLRGAGENLRLILAPDAAIRNDLELALQQLGTAGQSIAELVDFLKRNPNALLTGRQIIPTGK